MLDPRLEPLVAEHLRGGEGAYEVLRDALLERGLEPLPAAGESVERLDGVFVRLPVVDQVRIASASLRRLVPEIVDRRAREWVTEALDLVESDPDTPAPDMLRNELFRAWQARPTAAGARVVWAAWMLLRALPSEALRIARALRPGELDLQIALAARAFASRLT